MQESHIIFVVEDEATQRHLIVQYLSRQGFRVAGFDSGATLRQALGRGLPDLIILDIGLPGEDGISLGRHVRTLSQRVGIIMVTAAGEVIDRVVGLEMGADDYMPKPIEPRELLARVRAVLRRAGVLAAQPADGPQVRMGKRILDLGRRLLIAPDGTEEPLAASEFDLLCLFAKSPNRPLTREWLLEATSHREAEAFDRAIDHRVTRLRRKIEHDPAHPDAIRTVRGVGYMFVPPGD